MDPSPLDNILDFDFTSSIQNIPMYVFWDSTENIYLYVPTDFETCIDLWFLDIVNGV